VSRKLVWSLERIVRKEEVRSQNPEASIQELEDYYGWCLEGRFVEIT
jgi:hypothetical protein